jgi:hypothetical protein
MGHVELMGKNEKYARAGIQYCMKAPKEVTTCET